MIALFNTIKNSIVPFSPNYPQDAQWNHFPYLGLFVLMIRAFAAIFGITQTTSNKKNTNDQISQAIEQ